MPSVIWVDKGLWGASGPARAARYSGSVESHRLPLFLPSSSFVWLCSSCALQRQPQRGKGEGRGERELQLLSSLPSSPAVFLWLFVMPPLLHSLPKATAPWCTQIRWGGSAYDVLIIRFAITWGRETDLLLLSKLRRENKHIQPWYVVISAKKYHTAFWFWFALPNHCCIYSTNSFVLQHVKTAASCGCRYSSPHKSPDTDLDQVDKPLPPSICHTGTFPGVKGQMEKDSFLASPFPLCLRMCYMLNMRWRGSLSPALWGMWRNTLLPSCGQM